MRRSIAVFIAIAALMAVAGPGASAQADEVVEGCVATPGAPCSYVATRAGSVLAAGGPWKVTITRPDGTLVTHGGEYEVPTMINAIRAGDRVSAWAAVGPGLTYRKAGVVRVGNDLRSEGCTHFTWGTPCVYQATRSGGILAVGPWWQVEIKRGREHLSYGACGCIPWWFFTSDWVFWKSNAIRKGDLVWVLAVHGFVGTGPDYNLPPA